MRLPLPLTQLFFRRVGSLAACLTWDALLNVVDQVWVLVCAGGFYSASPFSASTTKARGLEAGGGRCYACYGSCARWTIAKTLFSASSQRCVAYVGLWLLWDGNSAVRFELAGSGLHCRLTACGSANASPAYVRLVDTVLSHVCCRRHYLREPVICCKVTETGAWGSKETGKRRGDKRHHRGENDGGE